MKTLETIQKTCKVFHILAKVAMILSFVWAGLNAVGVVCCIIWHSIGVDPSSFIDVALFEENGGVIKTIGVLSADFVFGLTDGISFLFATQYLKKELEDGTPFTLEGADKVKSLGIKTIVMPLVAVIISAVIYASFGLSQYEKFSNGAPVVLGIALILVSLILRHGAELRGETNDNAQD